MDGTLSVQKREGGVAVIPVSGPIFRYANLFTEISGASSTENLSTDFDAAIEDRSVTSILFTFESPGGMTDGANEFQNRVFEARGKKPIIAYVGERACSLAYLYASACDEIVIDAIGEVGSIGVMSKSRADSQSASVVTVKSRRAPRKNLDPGTEAGKAALLNQVNAIEDVFVAAIARNRSMTEEAVTKEEGAVLIGQQAVDAGLADRLGSFEGLITELGGASSGVRPGSYAFNRQEEKVIMATKVLTAEERIAELEALSASQRTELAESRKLNTTALESQVTAEVAAFVAPLKLAGEGGDLRFNAKELTSIEGMLKAAKLAAFGVGQHDIKTLGTFFVAELTAYVAAKSPAAPAGELPKAADLGAGLTPSAAVFSAALMGDRAAVAVVSAYVDKLHLADPKKSKPQHLAEATAAAKAAAVK